MEPRSGGEDQTATGGTVGRMDVFVLMEDGGYDGDALLGVFSTEDAAENAGTSWRRRREFRGDSTYVCRVEVDAPAMEHPTESSVVS
jgi:hypothetical protein